MTIIRKYNGLMPDYLDRFFGRDYDEVKQWQVNTPALNIVERNEEFVIELAAPGYDKKDFTVNVDNDELTISAKKLANQSDGYVRREFNYGDFERTFTLPLTIETDRIKAVYENGLLHVTLPKKEEAKVKPPKMIEIK